MREKRKKEKKAFEINGVLVLSWLDSLRVRVLSLIGRKPHHSIPIHFIVHILGSCVSYV